jgi:hypothetical protein
MPVQALIISPHFKALFRYRVFRVILQEAQPNNLLEAKGGKLKGLKMFLR